ncbi:MAG TPA: hypothetical protein VM577_01010 [Anaerovoracaceae bacterium]|nr:hypothetical protein [Anaerovoracaceae bacterium]
MKQRLLKLLESLEDQELSFNVLDWRLVDREEDRKKLNDEVTQLHLENQSLLDQCIDEFASPFLQQLRQIKHITKIEVIPTAQVFFEIGSPLKVNVVIHHSNLPKFLEINSSEEYIDFLATSNDFHIRISSTHDNIQSDSLRNYLIETFQTEAMPVIEHNRLEASINQAPTTTRKTKI